MSRGEISVEGNQVKSAASGDWATEYQQQHGGGQTWADQFVNEEVNSFPLLF